AQEAHEAIRPTDFSVEPGYISKQMGSAEGKLYEMIYNRALSSQMSNRESEVISASLTAEGSSGIEYMFRMGAERLLFDGFRKVLKTKSKDQDAELQQVENLKEGENFDIKEILTQQNFTKPKARYTDASLVKALEKLGVGRPSTYATIISTVQSRGYVEKQGRYLHPLDVGRVVNEFLCKNFARLVNYEYTAGVEEKLDLITENKVEYEPFIDAEYKPLLKELQAADKNVNKEDVVILGSSEEKCDECGSPMVVRLGRYGKFLSCKRFPECKGIKNIDGGEENLDYEKYMKPDSCPKCGSKLVLKMGKYGKFWACEKYPECKGTLPMLLNKKCPECSKPLVERRSKWGKMFIGCSGYPDCKFIEKKKKKE
ncbi:topoisomerase DNA-binding C4 zinc finger domain-containing protein, partial [Candidatus Dojkabacteria bacterium]|nr:topoisomerase DNA-binding C4 zinc finger domain-containing protein [Candidatus Dojkabacteria bacterium]